MNLSSIRNVVWFVGVSLLMPLSTVYGSPFADEEGYQANSSERRIAGGGPSGPESQQKRIKRKQQASVDSPERAMSKRNERAAAARSNEPAARSGGPFLDSSVGSASRTKSLRQGGPNGPPSLKERKREAKQKRQLAQGRAEAKQP